MSAQKIIWTQRGMLALIADHVVECVSAATRRGRDEISDISLADFLASDQLDADHVCVLLSRSEVFEQNLNARTPSQRLQRKILSQPDTVSSPISDEETVVFVRSDAQDKSRLKLSHIRAETLESIATHADALHLKSVRVAPDHTPNQSIETPYSQAQKSRTSLYWLVSIVALIFGAYVLFSAFAHTAQQSSDANAIKERGLRAQVLALTDRELDISALDVLADQKAETLTPVARLDLLAKITAATPDSSMWRKITVKDQTITLEGSSADIAALEVSMREAFETYDLSLVEGDQVEGADRFDVVLSLTETGAE